MGGGSKDARGWFGEMKDLLARGWRKGRCRLFGTTETWEIEVRQFVSMQSVCTYVFFLVRVFIGEWETDSRRGMDILDTAGLMTIIEAAAAAAVRGV
jgi:hypothetical protein